MKKAIFAIIIVVIAMAFIMPMTKAATPAQFVITSGPTFSATHGYPGDTISVTVTIKNTGGTYGNYIAEAGIVRKGWDGYSLMPWSGWKNFLYSGWVGYKCCDGNAFYDGKQVALAPNEAITITLHPQVPFSNSIDVCNNQGSAWSGYTNNYWIGFNACNNCYGEAGHSCIEIFSDNWKTFTVEEGGTAQPSFCGDGIWDPQREGCANCPDDITCPTGTSCTTVYSSLGDCIEGPICGNTFIDPGETCSTCPSDVKCPTDTTCSNGQCVTGEGINVINQNKQQPSLIYSDWKEASPGMRIKTICSTNDNCAPYEDLEGTGLNYTVRCVQNQEILTQLDLDYKTACTVSWWKKITTSLSLLGGLGCATAITANIACGAATAGICAIGIPATIAICASTAAIATTSLTGCAIWSEPDLSKGACIAIPKQEAGVSYCSFTEWASLQIFSKTDKCKDGLYTILVALAILIIGIPLIQRR